MKRIFCLLMTLVVAATLVGCTAKNTKEVELVYVEWASEIASTHVVKAVLEDMGYEVELTPVGAAAMWQSIGFGDADGMVAAWLDSTHAHYYNGVKDKVEHLGKNLVGTRIGLVVPQYVSISSITEMEANAAKFKGKLIGIEPGAGIMSKTEKVIKDYNLKSFELMEGTGATMAAALGDAIKNNEWVVVTGWTPHWKFSRWKLKYLEDPQNIYGGEEYIGTIVRKGLKQDKPEVYALLDAFNWEPADMEQVMVWNEEKGADPMENARRWVKENPTKVNSWKK